MINLAKYLIENPIVKWVVIAILFMAFIFAVQNIKRYAFPRVDLNEMQITTIVPGFSALEMETEVTDKIEGKLENISGLKNYTSKTYQNLSSIHIEIDPNSNVDDVKTEVRNGVDGISDFPEEMTSRPVISEIKIDNKPMMILGIVSKSNNEKNAYQHAKAIKKLLTRSVNISEVQDRLPEQQIHILLNRDKMEQFSITFEEVIEKLQNNQKRLSAGTINKNFQVKRLITFSKAQNIEEIKEIIVRASGASSRGVIVQIKDIAEVIEGFEKQSQVTRFNQKLGYELSLIRQGEADIITATTEVNQLISDYLKKVNDSDLSLIVHEDDSKETEERLTIAYENALFGLLLVCVTLFLFLNRSIAFWSCWGIPSSVFLSVVLMWLNDVSINTVSLCGIIIMTGIIVDNPTIIGESTYHYRQLKYSNKDASLITLRRMIKPLVFAGLTTGVSFASMFFIPGILGDFAIEIPLVVIFMLVASFFESTLLLPANLTQTTMSKKDPLGEKLILWLRRLYENSLEFVLKRNGLMIGAFALFLVLGILFSIFNLKFQLFPFEQAYKINFTGTTDINSNLDFTETEAKKIEEIIFSFPEKNIVSSAKTKVGGTTDNEFKIEVRLISYFERESTVEKFKEYVINEVEAARGKGIELSTFDYFIDGGGPPSGRPIEINIFSYNTEARKQVIEMITADMKELGYFSQIINDLQEGQDEYRIVPKENIYYSGVTLKSVAEILRFAFEGLTVGSFETTGETVEWLLKFDEESKNYDNPLEKIYTLNQRFERVLVENIVEIEKHQSVNEIIHEKGLRKNVISANFDIDQISSTEVYSLLTEKYKNINEKFPDIQVTFSGEAKQSADTFQNFLFAIICSIIIIYLLLVVQFSNFFQPFMVITAIPYGVIGIVVAFTLHGYNLSFLGMIGVLGFGGVVINSSLIMVDYINEIFRGNIEDEKYEKEDFPNANAYLIKVVTRGASLRFRPIFITTVTTTIGLIPTSYGVLGKTDIIIAPMTLTMLWGLVVGTASGLYAIPMLYLFEQKTSQKFRDWRKKKAQKKIRNP